MPLRLRRRDAAAPQDYETRLAQAIRGGGDRAPVAAMRLLEHLDPPTLQAAAARLAEQQTLNVEVFDRLADAWETYRHIRHLSWD